MEPVILSTILDIVMTLLGIILFLELMQAAKRTQNKMFKTIALAVIIFVIIDLLDVILDVLFSISLDKYGLHQIATIIFIAMLIFVFKPGWRKP